MHVREKKKQSGEKEERWLSMWISEWRAKRHHLPIFFCLKIINNMISRFCGGMPPTGKKIGILKAVAQTT
jgi:hypothetical protein